MTISPIGSPGSGVEIEGPKCVPARFGLLDVAEVDENPPEHWELGFHHRERDCRTITSRAVECQGSFDDHVRKELDGSGLSWPFGNAVALVAPYTCSTFGQTLEEAYALAEHRLTQAEGREVERLFWEGQDTDGNPVTETIGATGAVDLSGGAAVDLVTGVGVLEEWFSANTACAPTLHASKVLAASFDSNNLVTTYSDGVRRRSTLNQVILGGGYSRDTVGFPANPGEAWLFASGPIKILRNPLFFAQSEEDPASAVLRESNDVVVYAERVYGFALGACGLVAGVKVAI